MCSSYLYKVDRGMGRVESMDLRDMPTLISMTLALLNCEWISVYTVRLHCTYTLYVYTLHLNQ